MKKFIIPVLAGLLALSSCEGFLDAKNVYNKNLESFYSTPDEINEGLNGVYLSLYAPSFKGDEAVTSNIFDDVTLGGGGPGAGISPAMDNFTDPFVDMYREIWTLCYQGIYRANALIENISAEGKAASIATYYASEEDAQAYINHTLAEAYFLRGYHLMRACRYFGPAAIIPSTSSPRDVPRSPVIDVYTQVVSDFKMALDLFPVKAANEYNIDDCGRANRWIAEGYLARAYMYGTGYVTNMEGTATTEIPYNEQVGGGSLTKADVIAMLDDCIANSGYGLLPDQRELWAYSYINEAAVTYGDPDGDNCLPWAKNATEYRAEGLKWAGQDGFNPAFGYGNNETMFMIRAGFSSWGADPGQGRNNRYGVQCGPRNCTQKPFFQGHGMNTVNTLFVNDWPEEDLRKWGSVLDMSSAENGLADYTYQQSTQYTGYHQKKYTDLVLDIDGLRSGLFVTMYGMPAPGDWQNYHANDYILMRYADILLMHDELTETNTGMTQLRARAGLEAVPYTLENLKLERQYEFAFEGLRYFDLVRWGDLYKTDGSTYFGRDVKVITDDVEAIYNVTPNPAQKGLYPFPETEVSLSNGAYELNPGWE